jgi:hypothetical protein
MWKHIPYSPGVYKIKNIKNKKYTFEYKEV